MDLSEILYTRTKLDLEIAQARLLVMSFEAGALTKEVLHLRAQLAVAPAADASDDASPSHDTGTSPPEQTASVASSALIESVEAPSAQLRSQKPAQRLQWTKRMFGHFLSSPKEAPKMRWHIDEVCGEFPDRGAGTIRVSVSATGAQVLTMSGWIVPLPGGEPFQAVEISLDDGSRPVVKGANTYYRADVQAHFPSLNLPYSGFNFELPMFELRKGEHVVRISGRTEAGQTFSDQVGVVVVV
jgi:hypothetical protein